VSEAATLLALTVLIPVTAQQGPVRIDQTFTTFLDRAKNFVEGVQEGPSEVASVELPDTAKTLDAEPCM